MGVLKPSKLFGGGDFYGIANVTNAVPTSFDVLQDQSFSVKADVKSLYGTSKWPEDISAGPLSLTGKLTTGSFSARQWAGLIFATSLVTTVEYVAKKEKGKINNSHQNTVANAAGWVRDMGVIDPLTGRPMTKVANAGAIANEHQYAVIGKGKYQFDNSRDGDVPLFTYQYQLTNPSAAAETVVTNQPMGEPNDFTAVSVFGSKAEQNVFVLNRCVMDTAELSTKQGDYGKPSWSYMASVDDNDVLGTLSFAQLR